MRNTLILLTLLLAACATPREACLRNATLDLRVVRALIAEAEATLDRGYGINQRTEYVVVSQPCFTARHPNRWCERSVPTTAREAVAVDLTAERRKLRDLRQKERQLKNRTEQDIKMCRENFPE